MFELAWPWALAAVLLPLVARWLPRARERGGTALWVPVFSELVELVGEGRTAARSRRLWLPALAFLAACLAAARPQWVEDPVAPPRTGRDLMLVVDVSGSMAAEDMRVAGRVVDRLTAVKVVLDDFIQRRVGDRLGLILFGQQAYQITPLTFDRTSVQHQLDTSAVGLAGRETAIGDALGLAVKRLRERPAEHRVVILLTDGANNAGALQPNQAAELAAANQVRTYTVAFGADAQLGPFGMMLPATDMDEGTLRNIAQVTGGKFFRARNTAELAGIYAELDRLEQVDLVDESVRPRRELYPWPAGVALLLALLAAVQGAVPVARRRPA